VIAANRLVRPEELDPLLKESNELIALYGEGRRNRIRRSGSGLVLVLTPPFGRNLILIAGFTHT
jgi:hypothetical protein